MLGHDAHRVLPAAFARHEVRIEPGSLAVAATGKQTESVLSHHHQGPDEIGGGLTVSGRSALDDTPEAIEDPEAPIVLGVLWHPAEDERSRVVGALVSARARTAAFAQGLTHRTGVRTVAPTSACHGGASACRRLRTNPWGP